MRVLLLTLLVVAGPVSAQGPAVRADNPLSAINRELISVLGAAGLPLTPDQEREIALMMEERRRASEDLFGGLMDFQAGPTSGQDADRLRSAIAWMRTEYLRLLDGYLTPEQLGAWERHRAASPHAADPTAAGGNAGSAASALSQTQYVRINNNAFTAEDGSFGGGGQDTDVIQRGGVGSWHGNSEFLLKDDALNARNAFAGNKPNYQERQLSVDVSGPAIPGRLTSSLEFWQNESENVDTVRASLPDGVFALGITRPNTYRELESRNTLQMADGHSVGIDLGFASEASRDEGIGGFTLPERASNSDWRSWGVEVESFSAMSDRTLFEAGVDVSRDHALTTPAGEGVRINVLDAFNGGGAQNRSEEREHEYEFTSLFTRFSEDVTIKAGAEGGYAVRRVTSTANFGGTFTFSSLAAFVGGTPLTYRVTRGDPVLETRQLEGSAFVQTDWRLSRTLMLMAGLRYDAQTNLGDRNNLSPRASIAYSPGQALVIRGGGGLFYHRLEMGMVETQRRLDGTRQFEIVIDQPSYPDPFAAGTLRPTFPSVRVIDPALNATRIAVGMLAAERTFWSNLLVTASYDYRREYGRLRTRDLNAPYDLTAPVRRSCRPGQPADCARPDPSRGNVMTLESTGKDIAQRLRLSVRKRFSIFNASADYQLQHIVGDVQGPAGAMSSDSYDVGHDWGRAPTPLHQVNGRVNARLPFEVFLTGAFSATSGRRYTITTGTDDNRDTNVTDRPLGVGPNSLVGPKYVNVDFNVSKAFFFGAASNSGTNMNVFVNLTNALNHVHYGTPSGVLTSPNFGRSTSASNPRELEGGVRFQF